MCCLEDVFRMLDAYEPDAHSALVTILSKQTLTSHCKSGEPILAFRAIDNTSSSMVLLHCPAQTKSPQSKHGE